MDVRLLLTVAIVLSASRYAAAQTTEVEASTANPSEPAKKCLTAMNVSGVCVQRNICDYSTGAIDLTLYAPHDYKRPCAIAEVCCPPAAIVHVDPPKLDTTDSDEDFM